MVPIERLRVELILVPGLQAPLEEHQLDLDAVGVEPGQRVVQVGQVPGIEALVAGGGVPVHELIERHPHALERALAVPRDERRIRGDLLLRRLGG
jgi:hypothetical protein